jgi:hypothetical protein
MNRTVATLTAGALAAACAIGSATAQNLPPPGNVNPGSLRSGAYGYAPGVVYTPGYSAFAVEPGVSYGPFGYRPGYGPYGLGTGGAGAIGADN